MAKDKDKSGGKVEKLEDYRKTDREMNSGSHVCGQCGASFGKADLLAIHELGH